MSLYAKITPLPSEPLQPIRCEVRTTPEDLLVCVVEQTEEGIVVNVIDGATVGVLKA